MHTKHLASILLAALLAISGVSAEESRITLSQVSRSRKAPVTNRRCFFCVPASQPPNLMRGIRWALIVLFLDAV